MTQRTLLFAAGAALLFIASPSAAEAFAGWHAGAALGPVQTHFVVDDAQTGSRVAAPQAWGLGANLFAGHDWAIGRSLLAGVGAELNFGGATARADLPQAGGFGSISPRWGYAVTARAGLSPTANSLIYVRGGFHQHRYRINAAGAVAFDFGETSSSFTLGIGGEVKLSPGIAARLEFHHLDGTRNQILLGIPVRF